VDSLKFVPIDLSVGEATDAEREWAARVMAASEPWLSLGRGLQQCRAACQRAGYLMLVARRGEDAVAFALLHDRGVAGSPYLASFAVAPDARGNGIGAFLLAACERRFRPTARHFFLCVSSFNTRARAFYERQGYRQVGELPDYLIDGASELLMHKRLDRL
jgi:[ribosomal protein S18]-alanine N-acetyltransferase